MQERTEEFGIKLFYFNKAAAQREFFESTTYLAKIAPVLQDAPGKMLTFTQIPVIYDSRDSKNDYWKVDCSQITTKMVRRHFKRLLKIFPELASKLQMENLNSPSEQSSALPSAESASCGAVKVRCEVKFTGPFSIQSLLNRDGPPAQASRASPLSSMQI